MLCIPPCICICFSLTHLDRPLPQAVTLPLSLGDGKWHHVCVTWSTRDGQWEAYQDGVQRGSGINLSPWHPIKPGGVFILGQEQVKANRFIAPSILQTVPAAQKSMLAQIQATNDVIFHMILQKKNKPNTHRSALFLRTLWGAVSTPPSHLWGRCPTCTCGHMS